METQPPACLTGVEIADREEGNSWPDDEDVDGALVKDTISIVKDSCTCNGEPEVRSMKSPTVPAAIGVPVDANSIKMAILILSVSSLGRPPRVGKDLPQ